MQPGSTASARFRVADSKGRIALGARYAGKRFALTEEPSGTAVLTPAVVVPEHESPVSAATLDRQLAAVESLFDDWDGHGSLAPDRETIAHARQVLALLQASAVANALPWMPPHVSANECGQIVLEWWRGNRSLTVYVRDHDKIGYLRAWGADIQAQMDDGELTTISQYTELERWLSAGSPA
jgi:hypothetical protein